MILIFDLDDTLYREETYAKSGFQAVSEYICETYRIPVGEVLDVLLAALTNGERNIAFQKILSSFGLPQKVLHESLSVYRRHKPNIYLEDSTKKVLHSFLDVHKYVVTDGNKIVQKKKIEALNLNLIFQQCLITHNFGLKASKPSIFCFNKIKMMEMVDWIDMVYIGDDPKKDFVNLKPLGVKTIRVMTGRYAETQADKNYDAEYRISNLCDLDDVIHSIYG